MTIVEEWECQECGWKFHFGVIGHIEQAAAGRKLICNACREGEMKCNGEVEVDEDEGS